MNHYSGFLDMTIDWLKLYISSVYAALSALSVSALTSLKDNKEIKEVVTSMLACGILALSFSGMLEHFGLPPNSAGIVGGVIGLLGVDRIRYMVSSKFNSKTKKE
ncbi:phage holin, lambda family (plasmid) [Serratia entomophila]|nr:MULTISPECIES: phage holin, lambda family [Serratia]UIW20827.1 phage holin, lambda family [Serratia entomophila]